MKKILLTISLGLAIALGGQSAFADTKKKTTDKTPPAADTTKPAADAKAKAEKPLPMHSRVDSIDSTAKSFTHKNKDGKEVKHVVTDKTEIKNGDKDAKFEDIKVGDYVSGLRQKKSETEYEVVKITKFGPEAKKPTEEKKPK